MIDSTENDEQAHLHVSAHGTVPQVTGIVLMVEQL
jgi:hypothetical protein